MTKRLYLVFIFFICLISGCSICSQKELLIGVWESLDKVMEFTETEFISINKHASDVVAFKGTYTFSEIPNNGIKMEYLEYGTPEGQWASLKGSELDGFVDVVLYNIKKDTLQIKVLGNNKIYEFNRIKVPKNKTE